MTPRFITIVFAMLFVVAGMGANAHGQRPPGGPPGGPPPGAPPGGAPPGAPPAGAPNSGPPGTAGQGGAPSNSQNSRGTAGGTNSNSGFGPVGRWWDDKSVTQSIGLRKAQTQKMDAIFNANKPAILAAYKNFLSEQSKLDTLKKDPAVDKARLFAAIDGVSQARASLQKATSEMLLQIRGEMDPDQITRLEKLQ